MTSPTSGTNGRGRSRHAKARLAGVPSTMSRGAIVALLSLTALVTVAPGLVAQEPASAPTPVDEASPAQEPIDGAIA